MKIMSENKRWMVGYGTFITRGIYKQHEGTTPCIVADYARVFSKNGFKGMQPFSYPFVLSMKGRGGILGRFNALAFLVDVQDLAELDRYEGVSGGLYSRETTEIYLIRTDEIVSAFIYVPTEKTIERMQLRELDPLADDWKDEIRNKCPEEIELFPELIMSPMEYWKDYVKKARKTVPLWIRISERVNKFLHRGTYRRDKNDK